MSTDHMITDVATAEAALIKARDDLRRAEEAADHWTAELRHRIVAIRPSGELTVDQMAQAVGRSRNYVDAIWSRFGDGDKGAQTRVRVESREDYFETISYKSLREADHNRRGALGTAGVLRAERDRVVVMVYASGLIGPGRIASIVGLDRNDVQRKARAAGVKPRYRTNIANQHTKQA